VVRHPVIMELIKLLIVVMFGLWVILLVTGCVTAYEECEGVDDYEECVDIAREYKRVTYYETQYLPLKAACLLQGGFMYWSHSTSRTHRLLARGQDHLLTEFEMRSAQCAVLE